MLPNKGGSNRRDPTDPTLVPTLTPTLVPTKEPTPTPTASPVVCGEVFQKLSYLSHSIATLRFTKD